MIELELILGVGLAAGAGVIQAVSSKRKARIATPRQFERHFKHAVKESSAGHCAICDREITSTEARIIFQNASGDVELVCDKTECVLDYAVRADDGELIQRQDAKATSA
jgi:hypothetical protein